MNLLGDDLRKETEWHITQKRLEKERAFSKYSEQEIKMISGYLEDLPATLKERAQQGFDHYSTHPIALHDPKGVTAFLETWCESNKIKLRPDSINQDFQTKFFFVFSW